jgi:hypothetical protein
MRSSGDDCNSSQIMRATKLLGVLFLVGSLFVATRGNGWHLLYIMMGAGLAFVSALLLSGRRAPRGAVPVSRFRR